MNKASRKQLVEAIEALASAEDDLAPHLAEYVDTNNRDAYDGSKTRAEARTILSEPAFRREYLTFISESRSSAYDQYEDQDPNVGPADAQPFWLRFARAADDLIIALVEADRT